METEYILGVKINKVSVGELIGNMMECIRSGGKMNIFYMNVHTCSIASRDPLFKEILNRADIVFCDGIGVKIGAALAGVSIGERMTPPDWIGELCTTLISNGLSVFLLGDEEGVAARCAAVLKEKYPGLRVSGTHHGFFNKTGEENEEVISLINRLRPDILLVGFGMPLQEKWITANFDRLNPHVFLSVGALFRWISGDAKRAPAILASNGMEGVWRLFTQTSRVWKRYIVEVPVFLGRIMLARLSGRQKNSE